MKTKKCSKCGKYLPMNSDYFRIRTGVGDGYRGQCKICMGSSKYTNYLTIPEGYKRCTRCNEILPKTIDYFHERKGSNEGVRNICKPCASDEGRKYRIENFDKIRLVSKRYYQENKHERKVYREENKEHILKKDRNYYKKNKARILIRNDNYRKNNPHIINAISQRRKSREMNVKCELKPYEWLETLNYFDEKCAYCGVTETEHLKETGQILHQDHFIPLSKGGGYIKSNMIPSCRSCNSSKQVKDFQEWYKQYEHYTDDRYNKIIDFINANNIER